VVVRPDAGTVFTEVLITPTAGAFEDTSPTVIIVPDGGPFFEPVVLPGVSDEVTVGYDADTPYVFSFSANQAGTIVTIQYAGADMSSLTCAPLHYPCSSEADCCIGLSCLNHDAGPSSGEKLSCDYPWARSQ